MQYFTTHADLVKRQAEARAAKKAEHDRKKVIQSDAEWEGDDFVKQTDAPGARITQWPPYGNDLIRRGRAGHARLRAHNALKFGPNVVTAPPPIGRENCDNSSAIGPSLDALVNLGRIGKNFPRKWICFFAQTLL